PLWVAEVQANSSGSVDVIGKAVAHIRKAGIPAKRIGAELAFLPVDSHAALRDGFPDGKIVDALFVLERLRSVKSADELAKLKIASEAVIDSMLAVIAKHGPGTTKRELTEALRREETNRGLTFEYLLITAGTSLNRAPFEQRWGRGDILSPHSGGNYHGYIRDLCPLAVQGGPDAALLRLLDDDPAVPAAALKPTTAGVMGGEIYAAGDPLVRASKQHNHMHFLAHGMGLVSHEAPRLTATGPVPYDAYDATRPLETGMVVSVETTLQHPKRGFI